MNTNEDHLDRMCFLDENGKPINGKNSQWVQWISILEKLPPTDVKTIFHTNDGLVECGYFLYHWDLHNVTHWMHLPSIDSIPPEKQDN